MTTRPELTAYGMAHLIVSAVRVLEFRQSRPPSIEELGRMLSFSPEEGHRICRKLMDRGIIEIVEGAFGNRVFVREFLKIEEIPREEKESSLKEAIRRFQSDRKSAAERIDELRAKQAEKKKTLFAELEKKLHKGTPGDK